MNSLTYGVGALLAIVMVGLGYWFFFAGQAPVTNYPAEDGAIVAFGDSLVAGVGATSGNGFVDLVADEVGEPIINLGRSGDTTRDGLARLDAVLSERPEIVILLLGGNDYIRRIPPEETFANLGTIIESIHDAGAVVVLLGVRGGLLTDSYAREYERLARKYGTAFVPKVLDGVFGRPALMTDAIHPNDAGYAIIAERVTPVVSEVNN